MGFSKLSSRCYAKTSLQPRPQVYGMICQRGEKRLQDRHFAVATCAWGITVRVVTRGFSPHTFSLLSIALRERKQKKDFIQQESADVGWTECSIDGESAERASACSANGVSGRCTVSTSGGGDELEGVCVKRGERLSQQHEH